MCLALNELGYHDVYHMKSAYANDRDVELWIKALEAKYEGNGTPFRRKQWDQLLGHCMVRFHLIGQSMLLIRTEGCHRRSLCLLCR